MDEKTEEKIFIASLTLRGAKIRLEIPVKFPFENSKVSEFVHLILSSFDLPIFVENDIKAQFQKFLDHENNQCLSNDKELTEEEVQESLRRCEKLYIEETLEYSKPEVVGDDEVFAEAYHALVHSPMLGTLLRKESALNSSIREMYRLNNKELEALTENQNMEMDKALSMLSQQTQQKTEAEVNNLATVHIDESHMIRTRWESLIESEKERQKRELRDWVMKTYQEYYIQAEERNQNKEKKKKHTVRFDESLMISYGDEEETDGSTADDQILQESFTIHLGSQMKQTYNIRLMSCHPMDFLKFKNESSRETSPQRLQMAISLYSSDLSAIVLLTDAKCSINSGVTRGLYELTQQSTEFHFDNLESQLRRAKLENLKPGDFLVTRHSNLNQAHVVFHLVCNQQSLNRIDINSRHSVILGLRNILKTACLHDITTITIPALLTHEMTENMSVPWCNKRAELVYKCVKGFMIEMSSWGGSDMKNLQFYAPKDISVDLFNGLASMLPNIFRVSNPLRLSSSSSSHSLQHQLSH